ncbi:hypothetical protein FGO68_gene9456 [Halteria grandinella]|uniref:Uncharacterized protein n=1 Tax=Halteria grandinella TaxID=5974 RepID=A0A8J8TA14_HALGN|nr:hypothetical protein FGO68_gene9456 [Halteria grandinella]
MQASGLQFDEDSAAMWEYFPSSYLFSVLNSKFILLELNFQYLQLTSLYSHCKPQNPHIPLQMDSLQLKKLQSKLLSLTRPSFLSKGSMPLFSMLLSKQ